MEVSGEIRRLFFALYPPELQIFHIKYFPFYSHGNLPPKLLITTNLCSNTTIPPLSITTISPENLLNPALFLSYGNIFEHKKRLLLTPKTTLWIEENSSP